VQAVDFRAGQNFGEAQHPVALPFASTPVGAWPVGQGVGVAASAVAIVRRFFDSYAFPSCFIWPSAVGWMDDDA
jgi:hypothetical protein